MIDLLSMINTFSNKHIHLCWIMIRSLVNFDNNAQREIHKRNIQFPIWVLSIPR